jgi:flagellar export protein FliJ
MASGRFSLEAVLRYREAEQEKFEKELARIGQERTLEREASLSIQRQREESIEAFSGERIDSGAANRIAFYDWLEYIGEKIRQQETRIQALDALYEKVRLSWRQARTEKEKIQILRDRFHGEQRIRERRMEEKSLDDWALTRRSEGPERNS